MHPVLFRFLSVVVLVVVLWGGFVFCLLFVHIYISRLLSPCVSQSLSLSLNQVSK